MPEKKIVNPKIFLFVSGFLLILLIGATGYSTIEKMTLLDSIYMAVITISTVGFKEVHPLSPQGKIFTICYLLFGLTFVSYAIFNVGRLLFENTIDQIFIGRRKKGEKIMEKHFIVCGFGRIGSIVARELHKRKQKFIVIEKDPEKIRILEEKGFPYIEGDATNEEVLHLANIKKARGIACTLREDADNLYTALTARELNPEILIVSRAENESSVKKLMKAGVTKVITPYEEGAVKIAEFLLNRDTIELVDFIINTEHLSYAIKEVTIPENSSLAWKNLREAGLRKNFGILVIGIKREDGTIFNPSPDEVLKPGDILIIIGEVPNLEKFVLQ